MKSAVFVLAIIVIIAAIAGGVFFQEALLENALWIIILVAVLLAVWKFEYLLLLKEYERAVIYTFGKVSRVGGPGWTLLFPPIEASAIVDLRTHTIDIKP